MSSSSKCKSEILELDVYQLLHITIDANDAEIKKAFRKKALSCHPDKNPDNPAAAAEFDRLKKILEVLLDPGTRAAYDKVLKGRRLAAVRASQTNARTQKLKKDLERREKEAALAKDKLSDKERFASELQRLEKEGELLIAEEIARLERDAKEERLRASSRLHPTSATAAQDTEGSYRVKVRWDTPEGAVPYTKDQIYNLFYKVWCRNLVSCLIRVWCCVVLCSLVLCGTLYSLVLCGTLYSLVLCGTLYSLVLCGSLYSLVLCGTPYSLVLCGSLYSLVLCNEK
ncbi:DnaJ domain [Trinorchestia longiramus]|nr:DnaJ domain [Trinorchestia longiramus]